MQSTPEAMQEKPRVSAEGPLPSKSRSQISLIDDDTVDFHALAEKHGFASEDGRLVLSLEEARVCFCVDIK